MAMANSKYSSLTAWDLDPDSYKTTIVREDDSESGSTDARSGEKDQSADVASITRKPEDADNGGRISPTATETKRTYAEAAGLSQRSVDPVGDAGTDPDNAAGKQNKNPDGPKEDDQEDDDRSSYATATEAAENQEETDGASAPEKRSQWRRRTEGGGGSGAGR